MKTCTHCGQTKPETDFYERKKGTGKRQAHCKACASGRARAWSDSHPDRFKASQKRYRAKNRDRAAARQAEYRQRIKDTPGARWDQIKKMPHDLYRLWSGETLLYVGITSCFDYRMKQHQIQKDWWPEVDWITSEKYPDRPSADAAETVAIRVENPLYNVRKR